MKNSENETKNLRCFEFSKDYHPKSWARAVPGTNAELFTSKDIKTNLTEMFLIHFQFWVEMNLSSYSK